MGHRVVWLGVGPRRLLLFFPSSVMNVLRRLHESLALLWDDCGMSVSVDGATREPGGMTSSL